MHWSSMKASSNSCVRSLAGIRAGATAAGYNRTMHRTFVVALALFAAAATVLAEPQKPTTPPPGQKPQEGVLTPPQQTPVIRRSVDLVTTDLIVRDDQGQFVSSL